VSLEKILQPQSSLQMDCNFIRTSSESLSQTTQISYPRFLVHTKDEKIILLLFKVLK
jgi:hypothetical protein